MHKPMKVVVALVAAMALAMPATAALASDETVTTEEVVVVEEQAPIAEPAPEPEAVVEETVAEPAPEPAPAAPAPEAAPAEPVVAETQGQPEFICDETGEGWGPKIDTEGDPATVPVTAPAGFLIDAYCVKAGTTEHIVPVSPAKASVEIDHPEKDSVSHYQVHLVAAPDEDPDEDPTFAPSCTTVTGEQTLVGDGVLSVEGDWDTTSIAVPFSGTLADIGTVLDIQADPIQYVGLHIDTAEGTISFEEEPSYGGKLWSGSAWAGVDAGMGYAAFGSIEEFIHLNGDVTVTGIRLLYTHPEASTTTVESFTIGCTIYTFEPEVITPLPDDYEIVIGSSEPELTCDTVVGEGVPIEVYTESHVFSYGESGEVVETITVLTEPGVFVVEQHDLDEFECPLPPVDEEPKPEPKPATVTPSSLATTGGPDGSLALMAGLFLVLAGAGAAVTGAVATRRR